MPHAYRPRRCSARWLDADCPRGVLCILDDKGRTADRFTVIYSEVYSAAGHGDYMMGRGMSASPCSPQGVGMSFELRPHEVAALRYRSKHQYAKWSSLPEAVKDCVRRDLAPGYEAAGGAY